MTDRNRMTFAGKPFRLAPESVRTLIDRYYPFEHTRDADSPFPGPNPRLNHLGGPRPAALCPRLNDLFYPAGASRWAFFRGLMARSDLDEVLETCFADDTSVPAEFLIEAGGKSVATDLYLLPPKPVMELATTYPAKDSAYLVTLVDERYYWQSMGAGKVRPQDAETWEDLIDQLASALSVMIDVDAVDADYGRPEPDSALYSSQESPAAILDAAAACVGCVVCRDFDGTYRLERWGGANALALAAGLGAFESQFAGSVGLVRSAGGLVLPFDSGVSTPQRAAVLPGEVVVTFPKWVDGAGYFVPDPNYRGWELHSYHDVYEVTLSPADLGGPYDTLPTSGKSVALRTTAKARYASRSLAATDADPSNLSAVTDLATRLAQDLFDQFTGAADAAYPGVLEADPRWGCDLLYVWPLEGADKPHTRVWRPAWNWLPQEFQHGFEPLAIVDDPGGSAGQCGGGCGTLIGLLDDACLSLEVLCHAGEFASLDPDQENAGVPLSLAQFRPDGAGGWVLKYWDGQGWEDFLFDYVGGSGPVVLSFGGDGRPILTINGLELFLRCLGEDATFTGGPKNGFTGGSVPEGDCPDNDFTVRVPCRCCYIDGWLGPGIYCVDQGDGCEVLILDEADACDDDFEICSGPYATVEDAAEDCGDVETVPSPCSPDRDLPTIMYATFSGGTGGCTCLDGVVIPISSIVAGLSWGASCPVTTPCGEISNIAVGISCNSVNGLWTVSEGGFCQAGTAMIYSSSGPFAVTTGPSTPFDATRTLTVSGICSGTIQVRITEAP